MGWITSLLCYKIIRYGIVGGVGGCISWLIFLVLTYSGVWYMYAAPVASWATYALSFGLNKIWTFESRELYTTAWQLPAHLFLKLVWNALVVMPFVLYCLVEFLGLDMLMAQPVAGVAIGIVQNFLVCRYVIFNPHLVEWLTAKSALRPAT